MSMVTMSKCEFCSCDIQWEARVLSKHAIMRYMGEEIEDYVDPLTGEVNTTSLAEDAC